MDDQGTNAYDVNTGNSLNTKKEYRIYETHDEKFDSYQIILYKVMHCSIFQINEDSLFLTSN